MQAGYMSPKEVAALWGVDDQTVLRLIRTGKLTGFKIGRLWRVSPYALRAYEEGNSRKALPSLNKRRIVTRIT